MYKYEQIYGIGMLLPPHAEATIGQDFFLVLCCCHLQWGRNASTKNGSPKFRSILCKCKQLKGLLPHHYWQGFLDSLIFFSGFTHHNGKGFLNFASKCKQLYRLLPHHCWKEFFALVICSITSNEANMLPPKIGLSSLGVVFNQARYSLVRDSYHQEYSS